MSNKPDGWWSFIEDGTRAGVLKKLADNAEVPVHWKSAIKTDIEKLPQEFNYVSVDAHFHTHFAALKTGEVPNQNLHLTITPGKISM